MTLPAENAPPTSWMTSLADAYVSAREDHPNDELLLVSDIDGTIIDMRYLVVAVLQEYDRAHSTAHFAQLQPGAVDVHENDIGPLLDTLGLPPSEHQRVTRWYFERRWQESSILSYHRPFPGVIPTLRWFDLQDNTSIGLITGRPEYLRSATLRSLNAVGNNHSLVFDDKMLLMNPRDWEQDVVETKVAGVRRFREMGYRVFAVIDNEPSVLEALADEVELRGVLFLHADTTFESRSSPGSRRIIQGTEYTLAQLLPGDGALPSGVEHVWHGVNDPANLRHFLASGVRWAEIDVRADPSGELILRHDSFETTAPVQGEKWLTYSAALAELVISGAGIKFDIKGGPDILDEVLESVASSGLPDDRLWFNSEIETLGEAEFRKIRRAHPEAILQCPIGWLSPLLASAPNEARRILRVLSDWGMSRFSVGWDRNASAILNQLSSWGYEVNLYGMADLENFLEAVLLLPRSATADFNFPTWDYFGRGSGKGGHWFVYEDKPASTLR